MAGLVMGYLGLAWFLYIIIRTIRLNPEDVWSSFGEAGFQIVMILLVTGGSAAIATKKK
jgi:hypothetical protein